MNYNPEKHHRRSIRLKGYDYSCAGLYFITLCVQDRIPLFGSINNKKMNLNIFGDIAHIEWLKSLEIRPNISLGAFIIMPNHFHAIIAIDYQIKENKNIGEFKSPSQTIGAIIRGYKGATTKKIKNIIRNSSENSGDSELKIIDSNISTGELQFASTPNKEIIPNTGELQFAPTLGESLFAPTPNKEIIPNTGELQFAPTEILNKIDLTKSIWQRNYYEHIIRDERAYKNISNYIINNPKKWEADKFNRNNLR